jgi:Zn-dependent protease with chaperone function
VILEAFENFLFFGTAFALMGFAVAWGARAGARWRPDTLRPHILARLYTLALVLPPVGAAWLVSAALLPCWWLGEYELYTAHPDPIHPLHLVGALTNRLEPVLAYTVAVIVGGTALFLVWSTARGHRRLAWAVARLQLVGASPPPAHLAIVEEIARRHGLEVGLVQSDYPLSFVWGFRRSKLVLSSGLLATLTSAELAGVLEHEAAHHARRDNLVKLGLAVCAYASLAAPLGRRLLRWRSEQVELLCDEIAAVRSSAPLDIAEALVKLRRCTQRAMARPALAAQASHFVPDDERSVERRVRHLLAFADATSLPIPAPAPPRAAPLLALAALFSLSLAALGASAPLAIHAAAESVLQALK